MPPLTVLEVLGTRLIQSVCVVKGTTADSSTSENHDVFQHVHALDAKEPQLGSPQVLVKPPAGLGKVFIFEPSTGFENCHSVAFFGQPQSRNRATETGTDDYNIEIALFTHGKSHLL